MEAERLGDVCLGEVALKGFARWAWELDARGREQTQRRQ